MSKSFTPFSEVFRSEFSKYYAKMGNPPTHVLIGRKEKKLLDEEIKNTAVYRVTNPRQIGKSIYSGVEILTTEDKESIVYFFTKE